MDRTAKKLIAAGTLAGAAWLTDEKVGASITCNDMANECASYDGCYPSMSGSGPVYFMNCVGACSYWQECTF